MRKEQEKSLSGSVRKKRALSVGSKRSLDFEAQSFLRALLPKDFPRTHSELQNNLAENYKIPVGEIEKLFSIHTGRARILKFDISIMYLFWPVLTQYEGLRILRF